MAWWWEGASNEKFWCEITDRKDIGSDLKCPQTDDAGRDSWSYSLIQAVWPGDVVFHYSTRSRSFVGASVASGPLEQRKILWAAQGTVGRTKARSETWRTGWWLPLYGYKAASRPLSIKGLQNPAERDWIYQWIAGKEKHSSTVAAPFQRSSGTLRANQGYLTKMPAEFVKRWPELSSLADSLSGVEDDLAALSSQFPPKFASAPTSRAFQPKNSDPYVAVVRSQVQRKSSHHKALVENVAKFLGECRHVSNPHPIDLLISGTPSIICEFKLARGNPGGAIREAVGQLFEYRFFLGPRDGLLCIILDGAPAAELIHYVETVLDMLLLWVIAGRVYGGLKSVAVFNGLGIPVLLQ